MSKDSWCARGSCPTCPTSGGPEAGRGREREGIFHEGDYGGSCGFGPWSSLLAPLRSAPSSVAALKRLVVLDH